MVKEIKLTQGKSTLVDDEDFDYLSQWKWYYSGRYAKRNLKISGKSISINMHSVIMNTPKGMETDHINGDGLDNRKSNLRIGFTSQNQINRGKQLNNTSGYKGVYLDKRNPDRPRWFARIMVEKKNIHLGTFYNIQDAAKRYDDAALHYFGAFAQLNLGE